MNESMFNVYDRDTQSSFSPLPLESFGGPSSSYSTMIAPQAGSYNNLWNGPLNLRSAQQDPPYPLPGPINNAGASSSSTDAVREAIKAEKRKKKNYDRRQALKARKEPKAHAPKGQTPLPSAPVSVDIPEQHRVAVVPRMEAIKAVWRRVPDNIVKAEQLAAAIGHTPEKISPPRQFPPSPTKIAVTIDQVTMPPSLHTQRPYASVNRTLDTRSHVHTYRPYPGRPKRNNSTETVATTTVLYSDALATVKSCKTRLSYAIHANKSYLTKIATATTPEEKREIMKILREKKLLMEAASEAHAAAVAVLRSLPPWPHNTYCVEHIMISDDEEDEEDGDEEGGQDASEK